MIHVIRFFIVPGELEKFRPHIIVRQSAGLKVGEILWEKRRGNTVKFIPGLPYTFGSDALQKIAELMKSIESGQIDLTEQLITESQNMYKKVNSNASSPVD